MYVRVYIYYARGRSGRRRKENRGRFIKVPLAGATPFYYMLNVDLGISRRGADPSRGALSRPLVPCWALSPFLIVRRIDLLLTLSLPVPPLFALLILACHRALERVCARARAHVT